MKTRDFAKVIEQKMADDPELVRRMLQAANEDLHELSLELETKDARIAALERENAELRAKLQQEGGDDDGE